MAQLNLMTRKNFLAFVRELPGSTMWRHLYVTDEQSREIDVTDNGRVSCAYMVSSVLTIFELIDRPHATVATTRKQMEAAGWTITTHPEPGAVVFWPEHIGFYLEDDFIVSNRSSDGIVARHGLTLANGKVPTALLTHPNLMKGDEK